MIFRMKKGSVKRQHKQKKTSIRKLYGAVCEIGLQFFFFLPVKKNKIVFDNFGGRGYGCDPKYIAEELLARRLNLDLVWLTQDINTPLPKGIRPVLYGGVRALYELATAKVWIDNVKSALRIPKKKSQYYIQTWHTSLGLKKNEQDAEILRKPYIRRAKRDAAATDLMYSNNAFRADKYQNRFWYQGEVIRCGHPRNGILIQRPESIVKKVREYFGLPADKKIVLYAPTFRSQSGNEVYHLDIHTCLRVLNEKFSGEYICLRRLHPNVAEQSKGALDTEFVKQATDYPDMQELLAAADVLITDYSGSMFEFMLTKRPVFLLVRDIENYIAKERGLYFSLEELPFEAAASEEELYEKIRRFDVDSYLEKCRLFMQRVGMEDDGNGSQVIADIILEQTGGESAWK